MPLLITTTATLEITVNTVMMIRIVMMVVATVITTLNINKHDDAIRKPSGDLFEDPELWCSDSFFCMLFEGLGGRLKLSHTTARVKQLLLLGIWF